MSAELVTIPARRIDRSHSQATDKGSAGLMRRRLENPIQRILASVEPNPRRVSNNLNRGEYVTPPGHGGVGELQAPARARAN
jgi:hypothetical protein